ncbi:NlpC/P60 family protein [Planctomicrobium sp. SH664]|uniref:NlpC/P60 family protein n=1 Tax=Planctomicrobium sp. SH664 TaxID=3448125 RepID=UPI003F5AE9F1
MNAIRSVLGGVLLLIITFNSPFLKSDGRCAAEEPGSYVSPYRVNFRGEREELVRDLLETERGNPRLEAEVPHLEWYSRRVHLRWGAWGPVARHYPAAVHTEGWSVEAKRERVIATALRFLGYGYQHHHIPDWDPPREWKWLPTCVGHNGRGVDCSNFTGFVYNQAFGLKLNTEVVHQSEELEVAGPGLERTTELQRIELPESYQERINTLRTGDLLYIRSDKGQVSHVVLWIGSIGVSPDGVPLILDSHGGGVDDSHGVSIPCGIHLRPFHEKSWYNHSAAHAHRVFVDE